jgi:excinuclease ABC subunit A
MADANSKTGAYLAGLKTVTAPSEPLDNPLARTLRIVGASGHNLKSVTCDFPVGAISVVTGVSGSGKSTLVNDTLAVALRALYHNSRETALAYDRLEGTQFFDKVIIVDQSPIGKTPRSNPATYTGLFALIREVFAQTPAAKERGYDASRFSFNSKGGGRCEACEGDGQIKIEMGILPAVYVVCSTCQGLRYNRETLEVKYKGKSIAQVLDMTVSEALEFFSAWPMIVRKLQTLEQVGLGYIRLGQSASTFSGGEAQRIKLAEELARPDTGRTVYILDEPTTGLHFEDVNLLMRALRQLTKLGNTVIVIEHNLDVIRLADWIVDMGPEAAEGGGRVLCQGTPRQVSLCKESHTAKYLRRAMERAEG